jgi:hypothetical protein
MAEKPAKVDDRLDFRKIRRIVLSVRTGIRRRELPSMFRYITIAAALLLALAPLAQGADLPVSYTVDERALKLAVAGTNVTFDLYTDSACTGPIAHTETVAIESVDVISRLKLFVPKGATVKPPKTDELRHTLIGVDPATSAYLMVTGVGIAAVGGACQPQPSGVAGPPGPPGGPAGPPGPSGPGATIVKDATGVLIGTYQLVEGVDRTNITSSAHPGLLRTVNGTVVELALDRVNSLYGTAWLAYPTSDCSGSGLILLEKDPSHVVAAPSFVDGTTLYYAAGQFSSEGYSSIKTADGSCYGGTSGSGYLAPAASIDIGELVSPFHLETSP